MCCQLVLTPEVAQGATKLLLQVISADDLGGFTGNGMRLNHEYSAAARAAAPAKLRLLKVGT